MKFEEIEKVEKIEYDGIIANKNWDGAIAAGLASRLFNVSQVEYKNRIRSESQKILLDVSLVGYVNLESCVIITLRRKTPSFFLFGNTIFKVDEYSSVSAFFSEVFDLYVPDRILDSLQELKKGYKGKSNFATGMFYAFLSNLEKLGLSQIFQLVRERNWKDCREFFREWYENFLEVKALNKKNEVNRTSLNGGEMIFYPLANENLKKKVNTMAIELQKKNKTIFLCGEKGGVVPRGVLLTEKELDINPLLRISGEKNLERLGKYRVFTFSFSPAQQLSSVKKIVNQIL